MVGVQNSKGDVISYEYDADGVRVSQTVNGATTEYLVDKNRNYAQVLEERVNYELVADYVYGLDLISQERGNADSYYLVDGLGSTRGLTNAGGVVTDTYNYDAFGNLIEVFGGTENDYLFAGEQFDEDLGEYYLRQRYYDSLTGRFTRRDTYEGKILQPVTLHKYIYANNNPANFIDPTGLFTIAEISTANSIRETLSEMYVNFLSDFLHSVPQAQGIADILDVANALSTFAAVNPLLVGSIWSSGRLTSVQNAYNHWKKHRQDFPNISNAKKFVEFAEDFVKNPPSTALVKTRSNGDIIIYDPASDLFGVATSSKTPRTLYKPDPSIHGYPTNLDYFNAQ